MRHVEQKKNTHSERARCEGALSRGKRKFAGGKSNDIDRVRRCCIFTRRVHWGAGEPGPWKGCTLLEIHSPARGRGCDPLLGTNAHVYGPNAAEGRHVSASIAPQAQGRGRPPASAARAFANSHPIHLLGRGSLLSLMRPRPISARQNPAARRPPPALASPHLTLPETQEHKFRAKNYFKN